ncbi:MAG TPA: nucleoside triphosphate pyrophosphohydrolase family protein [Patescibacteria group bacterium]|nr:nucleoside triphosphate pyrophosphohydrolase family protein [Patescibacteria group bacterium]
MDFNEYQKQSRKTALYPDLGNDFVYPTLGLTGEAGEVAEKIKKVIRDDGGEISEEKRQEIKKELGDVLWYVAQLCTELDFSMNEAAEYNLEKLFSRKKRNTLHGDGDNR